MTSLDFFPPTPRRTGEEYPEWGTGRLKKESKAMLLIPRAPNWLCTGEPVEQYYDLTELKRSNVRLNDQLLPNPQHSEMHMLVGKSPFPADHPYSSHISRFAVFPKFDSPEDPKRGVEARKHIPKNDEMPANPHDVIVVSKTKGSGARHEIVKLPHQSEVKPLEWHEHDFHQIPKSPMSNGQTYYPTPPKRYVPNLQDRRGLDTIRGDMVVSPRTANTMRNIERAQWKTTYDLSHTGLGPSHPLQLDNYDEKMQKMRRGVDDANLYPCSVPTFDPVRPKEGRIIRGNTPAPPRQSDRWPDGEYDPNYQRGATLTEKEENRLLNGGDYLNLPEGTNPYQAEKKRLQQEEEERKAKGIVQEEEEEYLPFGPPGETQEVQDPEREDLIRQHHDATQQMEAGNRWNLLESQKPHHDVVALQQKMDQVSVKTQPRVFYDHEGQYQRERAGLYKTSYDPYKLQCEMNKDEKRGPAIMDVSNSHVDALNVPTSLNGDMAEILRCSRTLGGPPGSVAQLHSQPSQHEAIGPFNVAKKLQKEHLQPNMQTADVRTQEGGTILKDSLYGINYNTKKFLQERQMPFHARSEPLDLMSSENQNLNRARMTTIPRSDRRSDRIGDVLYSAPVMSQPKPKPELSLTTSRPQTAPEIGVSTPSQSHFKSFRRPETTQFASKSSNFASGGNWGSATAYQSQFPGTLDLSFKYDERFDWEAGCGTPRPQSCLLDIQNSFSKTKTKRKFRERFPESGSDLRENITSGKKHTFGGMNSHVLRGAPIDVA